AQCWTSKWTPAASATSSWSARITDSGGTQYPCREIGIMYRIARLSVALATAALVLGGRPPQPGAHAASSARDYSNAAWLSDAIGGITALPTDNTVPHWSSSFTYAGTTYPYTM